jgi:DNA-binding PadR family transcriptional regulator
MSSIRLLVLGAVKIMQPVHGYDVWRELQLWRLTELQNLKAGSIYSALKTMEKDRLIAVTERTRNASAPAKTVYQLTGEGENELQTLLRQTWWEVRNGTDPLVPGLCLFLFMTRAELIASLGARVSQLEARLGQLSFFRAAIADGAMGADGSIPEHVRELVDFQTGRLKADIEWTKGFAKRLHQGAYRFDEEG